MKVTKEKVSDIGRKLIFFLENILEPQKNENFFYDSSTKFKKILS